MNKRLLNGFALALSLLFFFLKLYVVIGKKIVIFSFCFWSFFTLWSERRKEGRKRKSKEFGVVGLWDLELGLRNLYCKAFESGRVRDSECEWLWERQRVCVRYRERESLNWLSLVTWTLWCLFDWFELPRSSHEYSCPLFFSLSVENIFPVLCHNKPNLRLGHQDMVFFLQFFQNY